MTRAAKPLRAATYLRKSLEEKQEDSIENQRAGCARFAEENGWTVVREFKDEGISRSEFVKRPGLFELLAAAKRGDFDVVIAREPSRIGGDMFRVGTYVQELIDAGCELWFYFDGKKVELGTSAEKLFFMLTAGYKSEAEVEDTRRRTREAAFSIFEREQVAGGAGAYGYTNAPTGERRVWRGQDKGGFRKIRVVVPERARVVVDIFEMYAEEGLGLRGVAARLNERGVPNARGRVGVWAHTAIYSMLRNSTYAGREPFGKTKKGYKGGTEVRTNQPESEVRYKDRPDLRIVSDELWARAQARIAAETRTYEKRGATNSGTPTNVLSHILKCGECGGPIAVRNGKIGSENVRVYVCSNHYLKRQVGFSTVRREGQRCTNSLRRPVESTNRVVLEWVEAEMLREGAISKALDEVARRCEARAVDADGETPRKVARAEKLRAKIGADLKWVIEAPESIRSKLLVELDSRQKELDALDSEIRAAKVTPNHVRLEIVRMKKEANARLEGLREVLASGGAKARAFLVELFPEGLEATVVEVPNEGVRGRHATLKRWAIFGRSSLDWPLAVLDYEGRRTALDGRPQGGTRVWGSTTPRLISSFPRAWSPELTPGSLVPVLDEQAALVVGADLAIAPERRGAVRLILGDLDGGPVRVLHLHDHHFPFLVH